MSMNSFGRKLLEDRNYCCVTHLYVFYICHQRYNEIFENTCKKISSAIFLLQEVEKK